ncbi:hypothetical protein HDF17_002134 [Granulicella arctica]|uniref:Uncharacterized protein n=1 Tax=Granulicella arctica TaxID=940613 RepID=A0A7Y9PHF1_9BACT|nr:hypothetical protein [Granulicella arctica]
MVTVRTIVDLVSGLRPNDESRICELNQLALNGPYADLRTAINLTNEEGFVRSAI